MLLTNPATTHTRGTVEVQGSGQPLFLTHLDEQTLLTTPATTHTRGTAEVEGSRSCEGRRGGLGQTGFGFNDQGLGLTP